MGRMMIGSAMGLMAGIGLMMSPMGRTIRKDVNKGMNKAKKMAKRLEHMR